MSKSKDVIHEEKNYFIVSNGNKEKRREMGRKLTVLAFDIAEVLGDSETKIGKKMGEQVRCRNSADSADRKNEIKKK